MTPSRILVLVETAAGLPIDDDWLSSEEAAVLAGLRFPKRRDEWRLGRWTAKRAVARFLSADPGGVAVRAAEDGAPEAFVDGEPARLVLSISHREGVAAAAVGPSGVALGCDLEAVEPRSAGFVADYFTEAERSAIGAAPAAEQERVVAALWSGKESALKALRTGLRADTRSVEVELCAPAPGAGEPWRPLRVREVSTGRAFGGWWRDQGPLVLTVAADSADFAEGPPVRG
jgi:4'-phosphopantetheinyl transferase